MRVMAVGVGEVSTPRPVVSSFRHFVRALCSAATSRLLLTSPRSEGRVRVNRVRTVKVAALSDDMCRFGSPGAILFLR